MGQHCSSAHIPAPLDAGHKNSTEDVHIHAPGLNKTLFAQISASTGAKNRRRLAGAPLLHEDF